MPVPWDSQYYMEVSNQYDCVLSNDIWNKFEFEEPLATNSHHSYSLHSMERCSPEDFSLDSYSKKNYMDSYQEIRHHDCMWAGLCISKEHSRSLPPKKEVYPPHTPIINSNIPAGRSLLISRSQSAPKSNECTAQHDSRSSHQQSSYTLGSEGGSPRPETPQTSESDTDHECEAPIFKHDQIDISDGLTKCMSGIKAAPVSEVTGQLVVNKKIKLEVDTSLPKKFEITHSDHSYYINEEYTKRLNGLGIQTPSDSDEEIDVVSCEKPSRFLPRNPTAVQNNELEKTVSKSLAKKPGSRPRGRPPTNRKRPAEQKITNPKPVKRLATPRTKKSKKVTKDVQLGVVPSTEIVVKISTPPGSEEDRSGSECELDKRYAHNNLERKRRIELKNAFDNLRCMVPAIETNEKSAKVTILRQAASYCERLKKVDAELVERIEELRERQDKLKIRLGCLRRSLAMNR